MKKNLCFLLVAIFFILTCQVSEEERIQQVFNRREQAFQKRDLSLYLSCFSKAYQDKDGDFSRLESRMEGYFKTFDQIGYSSWDRSIHIEGGTATVTQQFHLEVKKEGKTNQFSGKEAFFLKKRGGTGKSSKDSEDKPFQSQHLSYIRAVN